MLKIATAKEMQQIDRKTIETYGIAGTVLMERAGLGVAARIHDLFPESLCPRVIVLAGGGNNGGDGLVIARILHNQGRDVEVFLATAPAHLKGDAKINYSAARKFGVSIHSVKKFLTQDHSLLTRDCLVVDALLGTGLSKDVRSPLSDVIDKVNRSSCRIISVDIPSGISSDTGLVMGCAVRAGCTVTFGLPKRGHYLYPGAGYRGDLYVEEIGFPVKLLESERLRIHLVQKTDAAALCPKRPRNSHKGTYGHVLIVAGSRGKTGAALLAARACLRAGAGLVTIGVPESLVSSLQSRVTEEMLLPLPDSGNGTLSGPAAVEVLGFLKKRGMVLAAGPGLSVNREITGLVTELVTGSPAPVVIDADGLNAIAGKTHILKKSGAPLILTPHPGEMGRLLKKGSGRNRLVPRVRSESTRTESQVGIDSYRESGQNLNILEDIEKDRLNTALAFAKRTKSYLVLKGVPTITATPDGIAFINSTGNPGMATAGSGDVLTGVIAALLAQGLPPGHAASLGVYIHGLAGDLGSEKKGERSLTASDMITALPGAFRYLQLSGQ